MMKRVWMVLVVCGLLAGCAASNEHVAPDAPKSVKRVTYLEGKTQKQVKRSLGEPVIVREESPNQLWAYYKNGCSTLVFFDGDGVCQHAESRGICERWFAKVF